jgi:aspartyl-tRNA(Asn)/glutamyl-tRNA(Gln) amidotransferase subunit B
MELVTEPVIKDAQTAGAFARELQLLLRTLGVSDANLEKGEMRIEANVSVSDTDTFGTKVEIKNLNSFRSVERSIDYEVKRQIDLLEKGEKVVQETRGWDEGKGVTVHQRLKEGSADYRYFPEPDLPKLVRSEVPELSDEALKETMPELPWERRARYKEMNVKDEDINYIIATEARSTFFDAVISLLHFESALTQLATNYLTSDLAGLTKTGVDVFEHLTPKDFAALVEMTHRGDISSRGAKDILAILIKEGGNPEDIAEARGLKQLDSKEALQSFIELTLKEHRTVVEEYRNGKEAAIGFLVGDVMKRSGGAANPQIVRKMLAESIKK